MKMISRGILVWVFGCFLFIQGNAFAQDEESAELFLEAYTDQFQEKFFEGLKQKGIENYDRAINFFLDCKQMEPDNPVIDHELARSYLSDNQLINAENYARLAFEAQPGNIWYLDTFVSVLLKEGWAPARIEKEIAFTQLEIKENLAHIYYRKKLFEDALRLVRELKDSQFAQRLAPRIMDSIALANKKKGSKEVAQPREEIKNPLEELKLNLAKLMKGRQYSELEKVSGEAVETYPTQPYFYFSQGVAWHNLGQYKLAANVLEMALEYLFDDDVLANRIYSELAEVYIKLGNPSRANMYLSKIKSGL